MLEKGIAYRKTQVVNWDPVDQTVLANEQVIDGRGWRTGALVEKREIPGYYLKITRLRARAARPCAGRQRQSHLTGWPDKVRLMQENLDWQIQRRALCLSRTTLKMPQASLSKTARCTSSPPRADTIMGVTFCAVAPEHPLAQHAAASKPEPGCLHRRMQKGGTTEAELAAQGKRRQAHGPVRHPPAHRCSKSKCGSATTC